MRNFDRGFKIQMEPWRARALENLREALGVLGQELENYTGIYKGHLCDLFVQLISQTSQIPRALGLNDHQLNELRNYLEQNPFSVLDERDNDKFEGGLEFIPTSQIVTDKGGRKDRDNKGHFKFSFGTYDHNLFNLIGGALLRNVVENQEVTINIRYMEKPVSKHSVQEAAPHMTQINIRTGVVSISQMERDRSQINITNDKNLIFVTSQEFLNLLILFESIRNEFLSKQLPKDKYNTRDKEEKVAVLYNYLKWVLEFLNRLTINYHFLEENQKVRMFDSLIVVITEVIKRLKAFDTNLDN